MGAGQCAYGHNHGALKLDYISYNPFDREKTSTQTETKGHPDISDEDILTIANAATTPGWKAMIALVGFGGIRLSEGLILEWDDVKWDKHFFIATTSKIAGKKGKRREVLLMPELERVLLEVYEQSGGSFVCDISPHNTQDDMKNIVEKAGFEPWAEPFHALRRLRDSRWKTQYPEFVVDAWLGHSMEVSRKHYLSVPTEYYESVIPEQRELSELVKKLDVVQARNAIAHIKKLIELNPKKIAQHRRNRA